MRKIFSFALVAVMVASMFSFVACKGKNEPEQKIETPTELKGTTWINAVDPNWVTTLVFETENQGVRKVHNSNGDYENPFTYEYADGEGLFTLTNSNETYKFTVKGNILYLQVDPGNPDFTHEYVRALK